MEKRTFIADDFKEKIINFLDNNSLKKELEKQIIYFYHVETDFRIIKTKNYVKMNLKTDHINEPEKNVFISPKYTQDLIDIFYNLGTSIEFKRYRIRHKYIYKDMYITFDENLKFGNVLRIRSNSEEDIYSFFKELDIVPTSMELFEERYSKYRIEWSELTKNINEDEFLN